jgi:SET domain-containing protein
MILSCLYIAATATTGRGVYTSENIDKGTVIEISPVIVMSNEERKLLDQTLLHDYIFEWGEEKDKCCIGLGYISVYNHSYRASCEYEMPARMTHSGGDFENSLMRVKTTRFIKAGEELFINYNGPWNDEKKLWFDAK